MTATAVYPVLIVDDLDASRRFYAELLDLDRAFASEWFTQLVSAGRDVAQIGFVARGHESIPAAFAGGALLVTVEVDDAAAVHARAQAAELPIELSLRDEDWGQRHFMTRDPNGIAVDVVEVIPVTAEATAAQYAPAFLPPDGER
jgi:catechol 2,3-dioxygenase-like lactoylglutathione lyase family enzyme